MKLTRTESTILAAFALAFATLAAGWYAAGAFTALACLALAGRAMWEHTLEDRPDTLQALREIQGQLTKLDARVQSVALTVNSGIAPQRPGMPIAGPDGRFKSPVRPPR